MNNEQKNMYAKIARDNLERDVENIVSLSPEEACELGLRYIALQAEILLHVEDIWVERGNIEGAMRLREARLMFEAALFSAQWGDYRFLKQELWRFASKGSKSGKVRSRFDLQLLAIAETIEESGPLFQPPLPAWAVAIREAA